MAEVGDDLFRLVEQVVDRHIILDCAAPCADAGERVVVRMGHGRLPQKSWVELVVSVNRSSISRWTVRFGTSNSKVP